MLTFPNAANRAPDGRMYVVKRLKLGAPGEHFGLALPDGRIVDLSLETGIRVTDPHTFAGGKDVEIVRLVPADRHAAVYSRLRAARINPAAYDLLNWNCETFVNFLVGEEPHSAQARLLGVIAIGALIAAVS